MQKVGNLRFFINVPDAKTGSVFAAEMVLGKFLLWWSEMSLRRYGLHERVQILHLSAYTGVVPMHTGI